MNEYTQNKDGYIVFEEGEGGSEKCHVKTKLKYLVVLNELFFYVHIIGVINVESLNNTDCTKRYSSLIVEHSL